MSSWPPAAAGSPEAARGLFAIGVPVTGTLAARYLRARGITALTLPQNSGHLG